MCWREGHWTSPAEEPDDRAPRGRVAPDEPEYGICPRNLTSPYRDRRFRCGEQLYSALGVPRDDKEGRRRQFARNFQVFGAPGRPVLLRRPADGGAPQWADLGPPEELMLFCGMAIGYEDPAHPANNWRSERAPLAEVAAFQGWGD
jgi:hypothetical protein